MSKIIISNHNGEPVANSLEVAKNFDKNHKDVLKAIKNIKAEISAMTPDIKAKNFALTPETLFFEATYQAGTGKHYKCYEMTRDGFMLLAMGFSGQKALAWKLEYIKAFNKMEKQIKLLTYQKEYGRIKSEQIFDRLDICYGFKYVK